MGMNEMKKITTEEFESFLAECTGKIEHKDLEAWRKAAFAFYSRIEEVQSNDPMDAHDIARALEKWRDDYGDVSGDGWATLLATIQPLTQRQGFLPDWDEADELEGSEVIGWRPYAIYKGNQGVEQRGVAIAPTFYRVKKTRPMSMEEKTLAWLRTKSHGGELQWKALAMELASGKAIDGLCFEAGICTEINE